MSAENMAKENFLSKRTNNNNDTINTSHAELIKNLTTILSHKKESTSIVAKSVLTTTFVTYCTPEQSHLLQDAGIPL